jgi:hypothetical protein
MNDATTADPSRRDFHAALALLAAAPLSAIADEKPADPRTTTVDAMLSIIKARYGQHLTEEQLTAIKNSLRGATVRAETLYKTPLKNSDEPAFVFEA